MNKFDEIIPRLIQICTDRNIKIATAESFTAGLIASTIASYPGASNILYAGAVTYMVEAKNQFLGIPFEFINKFGVVSKAVSNKMASNIRRICDTDIGIGATGYAGPGTDEGHVFVSICYDNKLYNLEMNINKTRNEVRETATYAVLKKLLVLLKRWNNERRKTKSPW